MSEQVMITAKPQRTAAIQGGVLQRAAITPIAHSVLQRCSNGVECAECRAKREQQEGTLQRAAINAAPTSAVPPIVHDVLNSPGQPLDRETRAFMEPRFGHDFSGVRVHTDAKAAQSARAVNALAYTAGRDVVFGPGQYMPETMGGKRLLAHELTHVVQQSMFKVGSGMQRQLEVGAADDIFEQEADIQASMVVASADSDTAPPAQQQSTRTPGATRLQKPEADISKAPAGLPCVLSTGRPAPSGTVIQFAIESAKPSSSELAGIEAYKKSWVARGSVDDVVINGYASADGGQTLNWRLSCERAEQIKIELSKVIPSGKITTIAHGETNEFSTTRYEPNRRAIITTLPGHSPTPPTPGGCTIVSCSSLPSLLGSYSFCGVGPDFTHADFPSLKLADEIKVAPFRLLPDFLLLSHFSTELGLLAGSIGLSMISRFVAGSGTTFTHGLGSPLSTLAVASGSFLHALNAVKSNIESQLRTQALTGTVNCNLLSIPAASLPRIAFTFSDGTVLKGAIGGTHGLTVSILGYSVAPGCRTYTMKLRFTICDNFGVSESDLYSPGLISFWILQHERTPSANVPFINEIIVEPTVSGAL